MLCLCVCGPAVIGKQNPYSRSIRRQNGYSLSTLTGVDLCSEQIKFNEQLLSFNLTVRYPSLNLYLTGIICLLGDFP